MKISKTKIFRCILCNGRFCLKDVGREFFPSTSICKSCYTKGQNQDSAIWCFGKTDVRQNDRTIQFGYNASSNECKRECPDRSICKVFALNWKSNKGEENRSMKKKKHDEEEEDEEEETTDDETEEEGEDEDEEEESESDDEDESDNSDDDDSDSDDEEGEDEDSEESDEDSEEEDEEDSERKKKSKKRRVKEEDEEDESENEKEEEDEEETEEEEDEEEEEERMPKKSKSVLKLLQRMNKILDKLLAQYADNEEEEKPRKKRGRKAKKEKAVREKAPRVGPFMASSIRGKAMAMALKGVSIKKIEKMVKKEGGNPGAIIRLLRSEKTQDGKAKWVCDDAKGHIRVSKLKVK